MPDALPADLVYSVSPTSHPLVARFDVGLGTGSRAHIEFGLTTSYGRVTGWRDAPSAGGNVSFLVGGMQGSTTYHMRAHIELQDGRWITTRDETFTTGALPSGLPTVSATTTPGQIPSPGVELINIIDPIGISLVTDVDGNIIWYYDDLDDKSWSGYAFPIKPLRNGHLLASVTNLYMPKVTVLNSVLREVDLTGTTVQGPNGPRALTLAALNAALLNFPTPKGSIVQALCYSHDVLPLWNGEVVLIVQQQKSVWLTQPPGPGQFLVLGDALVHLDKDWNLKWVWSAFDELDLERHPYEFDAADGYDWTHCNCVLETPDGNLLLSSRSQNWLLKLNWQGGRGDGSILWKLGYQGDFALQGGDPTDWFFAQHYPHLFTVNGGQITSLSVFDNGNDRCYATSQGCVQTSPPPFSRGAVLKIDETAMTAAIGWQYPLNQYSFWGGNVVQLINGDIEIAASEPVPIGAPQPKADTPSQVVELTPQGSVVWQLTVGTGGAYRSYRIGSLYPGVIWAR